MISVFYLILHQTQGKKEEGGEDGEGEDEEVCNCGVAQPTSTRMVGGQKADDNEWPWLATVKMAKDANSTENFVCDGSLLSSKHVLTSALCVPKDNLDVKDIRVRAVFPESHQTIDSDNAGDVGTHEDPT